MATTSAPHIITASATANTMKVGSPSNARSCVFEASATGSWPATRGAPHRGGPTPAAAWLTHCAPRPLAENARRIEAVPVLACPVVSAGCATPPPARVEGLLRPRARVVDVVDRRVPEVELEDRTCVRFLDAGAAPVGAAGDCVARGLVAGGLVAGGLVAGGLVAGGLVAGGLVVGGAVAGGAVVGGAVVGGAVVGGVVSGGVVSGGSVGKSGMEKIGSSCAAAGACPMTSISAPARAAMARATSSDLTACRKLVNVPPSRTAPPRCRPTPNRRRGTPVQSHDVATHRGVMGRRVPAALRCRLVARKRPGLWWGEPCDSRGCW
jgi:hypothetical protein